jgi:hypothetical protein
MHYAPSPLLVVKPYVYYIVGPCTYNVLGFNYHFVVAVVGGDKQTGRVGFFSVVATSEREPEAIYNFYNPRSKTGEERDDDGLSPKS